MGVDVLGIVYMKGDRPHCGFPEAAYHHHAETLARAGYKVVVIEQVNTYLRCYCGSLAGILIMSINPSRAVLGQVPH